MSQFKPAQDSNEPLSSASQYLSFSVPLVSVDHYHSLASPVRISNANEK